MFIKCTNQRIKKQDTPMHLALKNFTNNQIFADNSFPALNLATFLALILITAPV